MTLYTTVDSPLGSLLVAATDRGVVRVAFERENFDAVTKKLAQSLGGEAVRASGRFDGADTGETAVLGQAVRQLDDYFAGRRTDFEVPLDFALTNGFRQQVQQYLPNIGFGDTATYKAVAAGVGRPDAVRAVGSACANNPLPIVLPCHRVVRSDGGLGGYLGGLDAKRVILDLERGRS